MPQPQGRECTCCGKTFYTTPREDNLDDHCPKCAHEQELYDLRVNDLRRVVEVWAMESGLNPVECSQFVDALNM